MSTRLINFRLITDTDIIYALVYVCTHRRINIGDHDRTKTRREFRKHLRRPDATRGNDDRAEASRRNPDSEVQSMRKS